MYLMPIDPKPFAHDPGGALLNMGLAATDLWKQGVAFPPENPLRKENLQAAIRMRETERAGWLAVRTLEFPSGDMEGAAQTALAISAYHSDLDDKDMALEWLARACAEAPAGSVTAKAAMMSLLMNT